MMVGKAVGADVAVDIAVPAGDARFVRGETQRVEVAVRERTERSPLLPLGAKLGLPRQHVVAQVIAGFCKGGYPAVQRSHYGVLTVRGFLYCYRSGSGSRLCFPPCGPSPYRPLDDVFQFHTGSFLRQSYAMVGTKMCKSAPLRTFLHLLACRFGRFRPHMLTVLRFPSAGVSGKLTFRFCLTCVRWVMRCRRDGVRISWAGRCYGFSYSRPLTVSCKTGCCLLQEISSCCCPLPTGVCMKKSFIFQAEG